MIDHPGNLIFVTGAIAVTLLRNSANPHGGILVSTIEPASPRLLHHHPTDAVLVLQFPKVYFTKTSPRTLRLHLGPPFFGQWRKHAHRAAVLGQVRQPAPFRQTAEADRIFASQLHKIRIKCKYRIYGRVFTNPDKGLRPLILRGSPGPLDVSTCWKKISLSKKHPNAKRYEERQPAPDPILQHKL